MSKILLKVVSYLWLLFFLFVGIGILLDTPKQMKKDKEFIEKRIKPPVQFIDSFRSAIQRIPTEIEFNTWQRNNFIRNNSLSDSPLPDSMIDQNELWGIDAIYIRNDKDMPDELWPYPKNIDWSNQYVLSVWRGEWAEYYTSWNKAIIGNGYSWSDGIIGLMIFATMGFVPFIIGYALRYIKKRKGATA